MKTLMQSIFRALLVPAILLLVWELVAAPGQEFLAKPSEIAPVAWQILLDGTLLKNASQTFAAALGGFSIGVSAGVFFGLMLGLYPTFARISEVPFETIRPIPSVALVPLSLLTFGFGLRMEVAVVAFGCFWPAAIYATAAAQQIEPRLEEVSRNLGLGFFKRMWSVIIPASLPTIFVGIRIAAALALVISVTVEVAANPRGLGYAMIIAQQTLKPALAFAYLFWIGIIGVLLNYLLVSIQLKYFAAGTKIRRP